MVLVLARVHVSDIKIGARTNTLDTVMMQPREHRGPNPIFRRMTGRPAVVIQLSGMEDWILSAAPDVWFVVDNTR